MRRFLALVLIACFLPSGEPWWFWWNSGESTDAPSETIATSEYPSIATSPDSGPEELAPSTVPSVPEPEQEYKVVCYYTNWPSYRQGDAKYLPSNIPIDLCTHVVYCFAVLDPETLTMKSQDPWLDLESKYYQQVTSLKRDGVKVSIALGGWNDSEGSKYSRLVNNKTARGIFVRETLKFMAEHKFDGLELDWEYATCWQGNCSQGPDSDKNAFADFVKELHEAFKPLGLLLSSAVPANKNIIDAGYDVPVLSNNLDWIGVMTYDYHGPWDGKTGHIAPMRAPEGDTFNVDFTISYWKSLGADPKKLMLGIPFYGKSFTLVSSKVHGLGAPTTGGGKAGNGTGAIGTLAWYEICDRLRNGGWTLVKDESGKEGPYAYNEDQWVSFDDPEAIKMKSKYIKQKGLGGAMTWALDEDDFNNICGSGKYPLLTTISSELRGYPPAPL